MKSAARIAPALRQLYVPVARPALAGPSRVHLFARPASTLINPASHSSYTSGQRASDSALADAGEFESAEGALPLNISFEDLAGARRQLGLSLLSRGEQLHTVPTDPFEPILHPLSSLSSPDPTAALSENNTVALPSDVFGKPLRRDILHRNVVWYLSTLRQGSQSTKSRSTVSYSGRKLRPQKGSGKARVGDASSGTRRGGAPIHPLTPRNHAQHLPRKVRVLGLQTAISSKLSSGLLRVVQNLNEGEWTGTGDARRALADAHVSEPANIDAEGATEGKIVERFGPSRDLSILFVHAPNKNPSDVDEFWRVVRNIPGIELLPTDEVTVYDVLKYRWLVLDVDAVDALSGGEIEYEFEGEDIMEEYEGEGELDIEAPVQKVTLDASEEVTAPGTHGARV